MPPSSPAARPRQTLEHLRHVFLRSWSSWSQSLTVSMNAASMGDERFFILLPGELAQHVLENAVVLVVLQLLRRVDANQYLERRLLAVVQSSGDGQLLRHVAEAEDVVALFAREAEVIGGLTGAKLQR